MKALRDPQHLLAHGLAAIRAQFDVPESFPPDVLAAAETAAQRLPADHADWTDRPFVTLDPASSTDLDQAFALEASGSDLLLHYAIADVAWFVEDGDPLDVEAWRRGVTTYVPDGRAGLYPPRLSEQVASLLPDGPRPAVVLTVRLDRDGDARLDGARRALVRSRAKLAYEHATDDQLPNEFPEFARRVALAEDRRGATRVDPPEQEVERDAAGHFVLRMRPHVPAESRNAALSLAANLAVADAMLKAGTGLFRVMAPPDAGDEALLRRTAQAFHLDWPGAMPLAQFEKRLRPDDPRHGAFMLAVRRAGQGAGYEAFQPDELPWHAAVAAPYAHCTAPLRRLADRYVLRAVLALANGDPVPDGVAQAFARLPRTMARAESRAGQIERAVIELAEAAMLANFEGEVFPAVVTDVRETNGTIQLRDLPVVARTAINGELPGARIRVRLLAADPVGRRLEFALAP